MVVHSLLCQMKQHDPLAHYHRVNTCLWLCVASLLQRLVVSSVAATGQEQPAVITRDDAQMLLDFLDEMEFGYIHPRRTSRFVSLSPYGRAASASALPIP